MEEVRRRVSIRNTKDDTGAAFVGKAVGYVTVDGNVRVGAIGINAEADGDIVIALCKEN